MVDAAGVLLGAGLALVGLYLAHQRWGYVDD